MSMQFKTIVCSVVIGGLLLVCLWLSFQLIDQSVTLDHQSQHAKLINMQKNILVKVINSVNENIDETSIRNVLNELPKDSVFEKGDGHIVAEQVSFYFSDGKLERVGAGNLGSE